MKKLTTVFIAILFALSMTGLCFAQPPAAAPAPEKKMEEKKEEMKKEEPKPAEPKK